MFRAILYLLIAIFLITFLRLVIGIIMRGMGQMMSESASPQEASTAGRRTPSQAPSASAGGELKRDPVCGTFVPASTAFRKSLRGSDYHFCSAECRDKYV